MKHLIKICSILLVTLLLASCGPNRTQEDIDKALNDDEKTAKPKSLTMWVDGDRQMSFYKKVTEDYTKKTGIKVILKNTAQDDQVDNLSLDGPSGNGPDLFFQPHDRAGDAYLQGLAAEIDFTDEELKGYSKEALQALNYEGKQLALPVIVESTAVVYNKKLVKKPPKTMDDVERIAKDVTDKDKKQYGFMFDAKNFYFNYPFLFSQGGYIFKEEKDGFNTNDVAVNDPSVVKNGERLQSWYDKGYITKSANQDVIVGLFKEGKVGMFVTGPWQTNEFKEALGDDFGTATFPTDNGKEMKPFLGVRGWFISEYSEEKYWAKNLMLYLTNKDNMQKYTDEMQEITGRTDVSSKNKLLKPYEEQAQNAIPMPNIPEMSQVWDPMGNAAVFMSNGKDPKEALDEAKNGIDEQVEIMNASKK
ncbi:extracellular solute-binding protein [Mammaliicoccus sciuri]|uniref:extracellular solute-binding protein n=1 Tax=Mammaliicoccus TaxID=2803850 RepID=UPI001E46DC30|nr:extracellular solute-binding protein [Mammaliicoccus sciuri]MCD8778992.1 extracellular solute-binding protein [Mammaliicoccus sciuri]MCD8781671.1 extracellular solute-binding protein [Mammaliicoccus sciuri]MCD8862486.1 extracellular solute-binding protein [Mammaliicoccus sciuri]MEB6058787.1 extracellular solute-binding protein [Mammaliicoccus sciuri]MEB7770294.1 extracellular solute-binding protein [Mammaliicoccus sciuri]